MVRLGSEGWSAEPSSTDAEANLAPHLAGCRWVLSLPVDESARRFIEQRPTGLRLLSLILATDVVFFLGFSIKMAALPIRPVAHLFDGNPGIWLLLALVGRTAFFYALAVLLGHVGRAAGSADPARDALAGIVWGAVAAVPIGVALALFAVAIGGLQTVFSTTEAKWLTVLPYWLSVFAFIGYTTVGVASAQGRTRITPILIVTCIMTCVFIFGTAVFLAEIAWG